MNLEDVFPVHEIDQMIQLADQTGPSSDLTTYLEKINILNVKKI